MSLIIGGLVFAFAYGVYRAVRRVGQVLGQIT